MADEFFSGLVRSPADREWLMANGRLMGATREKQAYAPEFDPRQIIRCENQSVRNSCVGHGLSSCGEVCAFIDSGGTMRPQFSRWGAYIWSQRATGMNGRDNGAMISGAVKAGTSIGFCDESVWPYPADNERYSDRVPTGAAESAEPNQILEHVVINGYADGFEFINQGKGGLLVGADWTAELANNTGDVTLAEVRGRAMGGHCFFLWGWMTDGRLWMGNSHSKSWGQQGWRPVRPEVVDYWAQQGEVYGLSDFKDITDSRPVICDFGEGM